MERRIVPVMATNIALGTIGALLLYAQIDRKENSTSEQAKQKIALTELPIGVQKTIRDNLGGGMVSETAKVSSRDRTYYETEVQRQGGEKVEIRVAEDGRLIATSKEEEDNDLGM